MKTSRVYALGTVALVLAAVAVAAEEWTRARIARLPDSSFAIVEVGVGGRKARHLPHHDETGVLDLAHLRAARGRLTQVRWLDPANAAIARQHLDEHWREIAPRRLPP